MFLKKLRGFPDWLREKSPWFSLVLVMLALLVLWLNGLGQAYLPEDFSYSADLLANDNFFDPANQRYTGARHSKGQLNYSLKGQTKGGVLVESVIEVLSLEGELVGRIPRERTAASFDGRYLDTETEEYVFAPRGIKPGETFTTRHVTYDKPAVMEFVDEEEIFGLEVYRYETDYPDVGRIRQDDVPVPGVPDEEGLEYEPHLTYWIEPETGWLIKFEDQTLIHRYDKQTGERVVPFNRFRTVFTEESIRQHAAYANTLKLQREFARQTVPGLMVLIVILVVFGLLLKRKAYTRVPVAGLTGAVAAIVTIVLLGWMMKSEPLVILFFDDAALNPLTAVCFALAAVCLLLTYWRRRGHMSLFLSGLIVIAASLQLMGHIEAVPFGIDLIFFRSTVEEIGLIVPSRMSLFTAFTLLVLSAGLATVALSRRASFVRFGRFAGGMTASLGVVGLFVQFLRLDAVFQLPVVYSLSAGSSIMFVLTGLALMLALQHAKGRPSGAIDILKLWVRPALATIPLVLIAVFAQLQQNSVKQKLQADFDEAGAAMKNAILSDSQAHRGFLSGGSALFAASESVTRDEWGKYIEALDVKERYSDVLAVGFAKVVEPFELAAFEAEVRERDYADFRIFPSGRRDRFMPFLYVEPSTLANQRLIGSDLYNDPVQAEAIDRTRDSGSVTVSDKLPAPVDENGADFIMLAPVYDNGAATSTVEERRAALDGFIVSTINALDFMQHSVGDLELGIDLEVYDGLSTDSTTLLYDRYSDREKFAADAPRLSKDSVIYIGNHPWTLRFKALDSFKLSDAEERLPMAVLVGGSFAYFFFFISFYSIIRPRRSQRKKASHGIPTRRERT